MEKSHKPCDTGAPTSKVFEKTNSPNKTTYHLTRSRGAKTRPGSRTIQIRPYFCQLFTSSS